VPGRVAAREGAATQKVFGRGDHAAHAQVVRGDGTVGVLADDDVALLATQHVHGLGSIRGDVEVAPAAIRAFHTWEPALLGTLISKLNSPEKLMRMMRAADAGHRAFARKLMKGKAAAGQVDVLARLARTTARLSGPTTAKVHHWSVTEVM